MQPYLAALAAVGGDVRFVCGLVEEDGRGVGAGSGEVAAVGGEERKVAPVGRGDACDGGCGWKW